jgi:hypothetical protein
VSDEHPVQRLTILRQERLAQLPNGSILYEVEVKDEDGVVLSGPFRSFVELEPGETLDFEVRPFERPGYERTFTLLPQGRESRTKRLQMQVEALTERVNELENTFEARVRGLIEEVSEERALEDAL